MHTTHYETVEMLRPEFEALLEYSVSEPTATTVGKRWKSNLPCGCWLLREYIAHPDQRKVLVRSRRIVVVDKLPAPPAAPSALHCSDCDHLDEMGDCLTEGSRPCDKPAAPAEKGE